MAAGHYDFIKISERANMTLFVTMVDTETNSTLRLTKNSFLKTTSLPKYDPNLATQHDPNRSKA